MSAVVAGAGNAGAGNAGAAAAAAAADVVGQGKGTASEEMGGADGAFPQPGWEEDEEEDGGRDGSWATFELQ